MPRCENCGKENPATLCASCAHHRRKQEAKAAADAPDPGAAPPAPSAPPDLDALRERLKRVQEGLTE